jgi:hypothetical protein
LFDIRFNTKRRHKLYRNSSTCDKSTCVGYITCMDTYIRFFSYDIFVLSLFPLIKLSIFSIMRETVNIIGCWWHLWFNSQKFVLNCFFLVQLWAGRRADGSRRVAPLLEEGKNGLKITFRDSLIIRLCENVANELVKCMYTFETKIWNYIMFTVFSYYD